MNPLLRSVLYVPASNERAMAKVATLAADAVILDLEDAVATGDKEAARISAAAAMDERRFGHRHHIVRVNSEDSAFFEDDMALVARSNPDAILVPKVSDAASVVRLDALLKEYGSGASLWIMLETPGAFLNLREIAACSAQTALGGMVIGANDLAKETGMVIGKGRATIISALMMTVFAARAHRLVALDAVYNDFSDTEGFEAECGEGRDLGMDGKTLIHPAQIEAANRIFAPQEDELTRARRIVEAFSLPENETTNVINLDGEMVERLHYQSAQALLEKQHQIEASRDARG